MAIKAFINLIRDHQKSGMIVAEIGCWDGESFQRWAPVVKANGGECILVDNFMGNPTAVGVHAASSERRGDVAKVLLDRMAGFNARLLEGDSSSMANQIADQSLDICFIDADHRYSQFRKDILAWMPKVKRGGILCGHDCESFEHDARYIEQDFFAGKHNGVIKAVSELLPDATLLADTCWMTEIPIPNIEIA